MESSCTKRTVTVVQHWLLAIDRDRIAVRLSFEFPSISRSTVVLLS